MAYHRLDPYPVPKEKQFLFINEPWMIDRSIREWLGATGEAVGESDREPDPVEDNIRVYVPLDLNKNGILRRLDFLINQYGEANEGNELDFSCDVGMLIDQVEVYDQIWYVRHMPKDGKHSWEGVALVEEFVEMLEGIPDGGAVMFPFDVIEELRTEYID